VVPACPVYFVFYSFKFRGNLVLKSTDFFEHLLIPRFYVPDMSVSDRQFSRSLRPGISVSRLGVYVSTHLGELPVGTRSKGNKFLFERGSPGNQNNGLNQQSHHERQRDTFG
jgi:hypothetical protein